MNDFIVQLLTRITNKLDEVDQSRKLPSNEPTYNQQTPKQQAPNQKVSNQSPDNKNTINEKINNAIAMGIKSEVENIYQNSSLIRLTLKLNIFISMILICLIMFFIFFAFKRRHQIKKPYRSIFSFMKSFCLIKAKIMRILL
jgi:ATP-dependent Zn protease